LGLRSSSACCATHLSPLGWEHINLTGDYVWRPDVASGNAASSLCVLKFNGVLLSLQYRTNGQVPRNGVNLERFGFCERQSSFRHRRGNLAKRTLQESQTPATYGAIRRRRSNPTLQCSITPACLFLNQRAIKNRPIINSCLVGPPEAPAIFIPFFDLQVKQ
jgi:hypothetical protein